jgi:hypothetical protein
VDIDISSMGFIGSMKKFMVFTLGGIVKRALVYAPTAIKPAVPKEKSPVNPLVRLRLRARTAFIAQRLSILII